VPFTAVGSELLFEVFSQRHGGATLVCSSRSSLWLVFKLSHPYLFYYTCNGV
jgi:hypothetical protein